MEQKLIQKEYLLPQVETIDIFCNYDVWSTWCEIIYPEPGFPIYESVINYSGAKAVPMYLSEKKLFINADEVLNLINEKQDYYC